MPSLWSATGRVPLWMTRIVMIGSYVWHVFLVLRVKESTGWQQVFSSPRLDWVIDRVALNAKVMGGSLGDNDKMVAVASGTEIILWAICPDGNGNEIGKLWFHKMLLDLSHMFGNKVPVCSAPQVCSVWMCRWRLCSSLETSSSPPATRAKWEYGTPSPNTGR